MRETIDDRRESGDASRLCGPRCDGYPLLSYSPDSRGDE